MPQENAIFVDTDKPVFLFAIVRKKPGTFFAAARQKNVASLLAVEVRACEPQGLASVHRAEKSHSYSERSPVLVLLLESIGLRYRFSAYEYDP